MTDAGNHCKYCNRHFRFKDLHDQHIITCEYFYRSKRQRERDIDLLETVPTAQEQFKLIQHLTQKLAHVENELIKLKTMTVARKRKAILEWLNSASGPKPEATFQTWYKATPVTFDHLQPLFDQDITEGMKHCLRDYCACRTPPIPICAFAQKPGTIYVWSAGDTPDSVVQWRMLDAVMYTKWIDRVAHRFLETFLKWQMENSHRIRATEEDKDRNISNMHKLNGLGHTYEDRRRSELRKWVFSTIAQDFVNRADVEYV
jgi:hypothetical protein